jgi:hypothetical protein
MKKLKNAVGKVAKSISKVKKGIRQGAKKLVKSIKHRVQHVPPSQDVMKYKKFAQLGYVSVGDDGKISETLSGTGFGLDPSLSNDEIKVFTNPKTKEVNVSYRGTALDKPSRWKDIKSDWAIATGKEKQDRRFRQARDHFGQVLAKYEGDGYTFNTTGHSLGGQLSKHVNDNYRGKVKDNVAFSRGTGLLEPFRKKQGNTVDVSNKNDLISLGARLQGGKHAIERKRKSVLGSHNLDNLYV